MSKIKATGRIKKGQEGGKQNLWQLWLTETEGIVWKIPSQLPKTVWASSKLICLSLNIQVLIHFYNVKNMFLSVQSTRNKFTINTWILFMNSQLDEKNELVVSIKDQQQCEDAVGVQMNYWSRLTEGFVSYSSAAAFFPQILTFEGKYSTFANIMSQNHSI